MSTLKTLILTLAAVATPGIFGCDVFVQDRSHPASAYVEQPVYVEQQPQYVIVQQAPPPLIVERRPAPPSGRYVWVDGYWNWDNQRYTWQTGRYVAPQQPAVIWIAPHYESNGHEGRYIPGHWTSAHSDHSRGRGRGD